MKFLFYTTLSFLILASCRIKNENVAEPKLFSTTYHDLSIDTAFYDVIYYNSCFFVSQLNRKIAVLDGSYKRQPHIEALINKFSSYDIYKRNDSLIFLKYNRKWISELYYLTKDFNLIALKDRHILYNRNQFPGELLFEDSSYSIYANRVGDAGFLGYFLEKATNKIYATFFYHPRHVVKFNGNYYIMGDGMEVKSSGMGIIKVEDPKKFVEVTNEEVKKLNILYTHLATSPGKQYEALAEKIRQKSYNSYGYHDRYSRPIYSFENGNKLFTIVMNDSSVYLGRHVKNDFKKVQQLFDTTFQITTLAPRMDGNNAVVVFKASGAKMVNGVFVDFFDCGFFKIDSSHIDLCRLYREQKMK